MMMSSSLTASKFIVLYLTPYLPLHNCRMRLMPRWSGLNHFNEVMGTSFTDGSKYEDIAKV